MKVLLWVEAFANRHPVWAFVIFLTLSTLVALKYLLNRDRFLRELVREHVDARLGESLTRTTVEAEDRMRAFETTFTSDLQQSLRELVTTARTTGVPLQIRVSSVREADLIREALGGNVTVRVSRRVRTQQEPEPAPDAPVPAAPTAWDRLLADDEEASCPPNPATPNESPKRRPRKKT